MLVELVNFLNLRVRSSLGKDEGQTIVEYVLIIVLIALAVFAANPRITSAIINVFTYTSSKLIPR